MMTVTALLSEVSHRQLSFLLMLLHLLCAMPLGTLAVPGRFGESFRDDGFIELSQAVSQLTQRFATLEVSLEARLQRLFENSIKGDTLIASLSNRLNKVDTLVDKIDNLDRRLTRETAALRASLRQNNAHHQIERTRSGEGVGSRQDPRAHSSMRDNAEGDMDNLAHLVVEQMREQLERSVSRHVDLEMRNMNAQLSLKLNKIAVEVADTREELLMAEKRLEEEIHQATDKVHALHQDLASNITSEGHVLGGLLQEMNRSMVEGVARLTGKLNNTLTDHRPSRRGHTSETSSRPSATQALHCPDPATVAALQEVKQLLQSVLKRSEDLRRGLTKQTSEGIDLLKLLHQRFSVLLRRINTDPDHGEMLVTEMQNLGTLVESSYTAVLFAQNAFIESCKRVQSEEPTLELKITEVLDKLITNIDLGHQFNRMQLSELRELVTNLVEAEETLSPEVVEDDSVLRNDDHNLVRTTIWLDEAQEILQEAIESTNMTVKRLSAVEERVDTVSQNLVTKDWTSVCQKEPADQLVTAAKDLKGYARNQIDQSLDIHQVLLLILEQISARGRGDSSLATQPLDFDLTFLKRNYGDDGGNTELTKPSLILPSTCTASLIQQIQARPEFRSGSSLAATSSSFLETASGLEEGREENEGDEEDEGEGEERGGEEKEEEEDDIPPWYTDPTFLSGNYGTPDRGLPVFRYDEWVDEYPEEDYPVDDYPGDDHSVLEPLSPSYKVPTSTTEKTFSSPGGVERYFGEPKDMKSQPLLTERGNKP